MAREFTDGEYLKGSQMTNFALGIEGSGVYGGLKVVANSPNDYGVVVQVGTARINNTTVTVSSEQSLTLSSPNSITDRYDIIVLDVDSNVSIIQGIANPRAESPNLPDNSILLSVIKVGANVSSISDGDITDDRIFVSQVDAASLQGVYAGQFMRSDIEDLSSGTKIFANNSGDAIVVNDNAYFSGDVTVEGTFTRSGDIIVSTGNFTDVNIGNDLTVGNNGVVSGDFIIKGDLYVDGSEIVVDKEYISGDQIVEGNLIVSGTSVTLPNDSIHRNDIELDYADTGSLRAEDIPYDGSNSIKAKIDSKQNTLTISTGLVQSGDTIYADIDDNGSGTTDIWSANKITEQLALKGSASDVSLNTTHRTSDGKDHSDVVLNNTHRTNVDVITGTLYGDGAGNYSAVTYSTGFVESGSTVFVDINDNSDSTDEIWSAFKTKQYADAISAGAGTGDMLKSVYDTDNSGVVDDSEKLNGLAASAYLNATPFECTVGATGTDYTTLGAAITAGNTKILVIDDTTETGDITMPSNLVVVGLGPSEVNIDMAGYEFLDDSGSNTDFRFEHLKITVAYTSSAKELFNNADKLYINDVYIDNNSTIVGSDVFFYASGNQANIYNTTIDMPNVTGYAIYLASNYKSCAQNCTIIGGGSSGAGTVGGDSATFNNITFTGTNSTSDNLLYFTNYAKVSNITITSTNNSKITIGYYTNISNITCQVYCAFTVTGARNVISNIYSHNSGTITCSSTYNQFTGLYHTGTITLNSNFNILNGSNTGSIVIAGDDNNIIGCTTKTGTTVTISSGNRNIISSCRTDAAIIDSGTDTVGIGNVVY